MEDGDPQWRHATWDSKPLVTATGTILLIWATLQCRKGKFFKEGRQVDCMVSIVTESRACLHLT